MSQFDYGPVTIRVKNLTAEQHDFQCILHYSCFIWDRRAYYVSYRIVAHTPRNWTIFIAFVFDNKCFLYAMSPSALSSNFHNHSPPCHIRSFTALIQFTLMCFSFDCSLFTWCNSIAVIVAVIVALIVSSFFFY